MMRTVYCYIMDITGKRPRVELGSDGGKLSGDTREYGLDDHVTR